MCYRGPAPNPDVSKKEPYAYGANMTQKCSAVDPGLAITRVGEAIFQSDEQRRTAETSRFFQGLSLWSSCDGGNGFTAEVFLERYWSPLKGSLEARTIREAQEHYRQQNFLQSRVVSEEEWALRGLEEAIAIAEHAAGELGVVFDQSVVDAARTMLKQKFDSIQRRRDMRSFSLRVSSETDTSPKNGGWR